MDDELLAELELMMRWVEDAGIGDAGEQPQLSLTYSVGQWEVEAASFDDGFATSDRHDTLNDALVDCRERLTTHPEREQESQIRYAAWALSRATGGSFQRAEQTVREAIAAYSGKADA